MLNSFKEKVLSAIENNSKREVTKETKYTNNSGIYMIYIDNFSSERIIPIYIGKTRNFQKRYKEHFTEIMALNRLDYDYYIKLLFKSFYDGKYKACKIYKYMVEHNCTLKDFHMIILEEAPAEELEEKEQEYFKIFKPAFFGFNQIKTRTESFKLKKIITEIEFRCYCKMVEEDISDFIKYKDYGYTVFNFKRAFIDELPDIEDSRVENSDKIRTLIREINQKLKGLRNKILSSDEVEAEERIEEKVKELEEREEEFQDIVDNLEIKEDYIAKCKDDLINNIVKPKIDKVFSQYKVFSEYKTKHKDAYENFCASIIENDIEAKKKVIGYIHKRQIAFENFNENTLDKPLHRIDLYMDYYDMFSEELNELNKFEFKSKKSEINKYKDMIRSIEEKKMDLLFQVEKNIIELIIPNKKYEPFPLKDMYKQHIFIEESKYKKYKDICKVNIVISNNGIKKEPHIIKIDYMITKDDNIIENKDIFIKNYSTEFWENEYTYYVEKDNENRLGLTRIQFNIVSMIGCGYRNKYYKARDPHISINTEFKTGINDYTLKGRKLVTLENVMDEIEKIINESTVIISTVSETTRCLKESLYKINNKEQKLLIVRKLMSYKKLLHK